MKILFTYKEQLSTFMQKDLEILKRSHEVELFRFKEIKKFKHLFEFLRQLIHLVRGDVHNSHDAYFCYFVDYHSLLPVVFAKLRRKKSIIIVAGYDCYGINTEKFRYGIFTAAKWRRYIARWIYRNATDILTVSEGLKKELRRNNIQVDERFRTVYFGYDPNEFQIREKEDLVLTVGFIRDKTTFHRKGFDRMIRLAKAMPEVKFIFAGIMIPYDCPDNVINTGVISHGEVKRLMSMAKVYIQPSRAEGLCNTVAEAMLSGCYVLTASVAGMDELSGGGISQDIWDMNLLITDIPKFIRTFLKQKEPNRYGRDRIERMFPESKRAEEINKVLTNE